MFFRKKKEDNEVVDKEETITLEQRHESTIKKNIIKQKKRQKWNARKEFIKNSFLFFMLFLGVVGFLRVTNLTREEVVIDPDARLIEFSTNYTETYFLVDEMSRKFIQQSTSKNISITKNEIEMNIDVLECTVTKEADYYVINQVIKNDTTFSSVKYNVVIHANEIYVISSLSITDFVKEEYAYEKKLELDVQAITDIEKENSISILKNFYISLNTGENIVLYDKYSPINLGTQYDSNSLSVIEIYKLDNNMIYATYSIDYEYFGVVIKQYCVVEINLKSNRIEKIEIK